MPKNPSDPKPDPLSRKRFKVAVIAAFGALLAPILIASLLSKWVISSVFLDKPEITLPILSIVGVIALMATLALVAVALNALNLTDRTQALGLPEGSVRAMIALSLIVIFVIVSVFFYSNIAGGGKVGHLEAVTQERLSQIPADQVISAKKQPDRFDVELKTGKQQGITQEELNAIPKDQVVSSTKEPALFDVDVMVQNKTSEDVAKQILTSIGTLIAAISAFYFGTKAVSKPEEPPSLQIVSPNPDKPPTLKKEKGAKLTILIEAKPQGEDVAWDPTPSGDPDGTLVQVKPKQFEYTQGTQPEKEVTFRFGLVSYPSIVRDLKVKVEDPSLPSLNIINPDPNKPPTLQKGKLLTIEIETKPGYEGVSWDSPPSQDPGGKLAQVKPNQFEYQSSGQAQEEVTLKFWLVSHPDVSKELKVKMS